jgi:FKBP-type peptidyl-prolyl cis-trans isomerase
MKRIFIILLFIIGLSGIVFGCQDEAKAGETQQQQSDLSSLKTDRDKESYAVGFRSGLQLSGMVKNNDIDLEVALQGIRDAISEKPLLPKEELTKIYAQFRERLEKRMEARQKEIAEINKVEGEKFLKANAVKPGVVITSSGLQYKVLLAGSGPVPQETDIVSAHYRGFFFDGREIENTRTREGGQPVKIPLGRTFPFWKEGFQLMKVGSFYRFYVPSALAYKEYGNPPLIGPNTVLVYEVELLGIEKKEQQQ